MVTTLRNALTPVLVVATGLAIPLTSGTTVAIWVRLMANSWDLQIERAPVVLDGHSRAEPETPSIGQIKLDRKYLAAAHQKPQEYFEDEQCGQENQQIGQNAPYKAFS